MQVKTVIPCMQINVQKEPLIAIVMGLKYEGFNWLKLDEVSSA